jgi:diacylglycerol O-acyltransferase / wax synthase
MVASEGLTPLSLEDARILALESGTIRGHTMKVLIVDDAPGESAAQALQAEMARRLPEAMRWRERLVSAPGTSTGFAWQEDPEFDIARHIRTTGGGKPIDENDLRRIVAEIMTVPLDRTRPLWMVDVIPRLADGRWAIVWKVHHSLADGVTVMRAGSRLLWTEKGTRQPGTRTSRSAAPSTPAKLAAGARMAALTGYRGLVLREFRRVWKLSPLAADVGSDRAVAFAQCTLNELRTMGKTIDQEVTINDVLLAVIAGALRRWLQGQHPSRAGIKVQVPVSMHPHLGDDDPCGNRDSFMFIDLPVKEDDPVARVRAVSKATRLRKNRHDARAIYAMRDLLSHAPKSIRGALQHAVQGPHGYSLNVSNVPGPAGPIDVLGRRVEAMYPLAEIAPHHALRVSALSLEGSLFIGLCADPHVVPDLDMLAAGIRVSIDELLDATDRLTTATTKKSA